MSTLSKVVPNPLSIMPTYHFVVVVVVVVVGGSMRPRVQFWAHFTSDKAHIARNWTNSTSQNVNFANVGPNPFFDSER